MNRYSNRGHREPGEKKAEHLCIAERARGRPLPPKAEVHHVDGVRDNNANRNLVICQDRRYHHLLHRRTKVVRAGGNPNTHGLCGECHGLFLISELWLRKTGNEYRCRSCQQLILQIQRLKRRALGLHHTVRHLPSDIPDYSWLNEENG